MYWGFFQKPPSVNLSLQKVFTSFRKPERGFFFFLFTLDPTKWSDTSTDLPPSWQILINLASVLVGLLIRESKEQQTRDSNSFGEHLHLRQRISEHIRYLLRQI